MFSVVDYYSEMGQIGQEYGSSKKHPMDNDETDKVSKVIALHPTYWEHYQNFRSFVVTHDGPLPYVYRHYLGIMAAARHQCTYLIEYHKRIFLDLGGNKDWLKGLDFIPQKLRDIYDINKILAHKPWMLTKAHIEHLTKNTNRWSVSEVVHGIVLLSHFHSLSSFVFSCGLIQDLDSPPNKKFKPVPEETDNTPIVITIPNDPNEANTSNNSVNNKFNNKLRRNSRSSSPPAVRVDALVARMRTLSDLKEESPEEVEQAQDAKVDVDIEIGEIAVEDPQISHFVDDPNFVYEDFYRRNKNDVHYKTFRVQDYSWDDHGYSIIDGLYNEVGKYLDEKFRSAYNLTYFTMAGRKDVDTTKFRRAIWNYILCIYGIRHDDYNYREINELLERPFKMFIKTACCFPEKITKQDYDSVFCDLTKSEKVHVNLMIMEARNQAELLYALRGMMNYMT